MYFYRGLCKKNQMKVDFQVVVSIFGALKFYN